jgi:hypothetical protein
MAAKPSRSHWPTVSPRAKMCPTLIYTWSRGERVTGSVGEWPVSSRIEKRWTPSPLNSGRLWPCLYELPKQESDADTFTTGSRPRHDLRREAGTVETQTRAQVVGMIALRRGGGTGRRSGLKIPWPSGRAGSIPAPGTQNRIKD